MEELNPSENLFSLYPNPSKGRFMVAPIKEEAIKVIAIYSIQGALIGEWQWQDSSGEVEIDISGVPKGIYLLKVNQQYVQQIVID